MLQDLEDTYNAKNAEMAKYKAACFIHSTNISPHKNQLILQMAKAMNIDHFLDKIDFVFINNIGEPLNESEFKSISPKFIIENYSLQLDLFENCTIRQMHAFCKINPDYLHNIKD